jgi:hypothetical protein
MYRCIGMLNDIQQTTDADETDFIDEAELIARLHVSRGSIINYRRDGKIPFVKLGHRVIYHWPTVKTTLLRQQQGGIQ